MPHAARTDSIKLSGQYVTQSWALMHMHRGRRSSRKAHLITAQQPFKCGIEIHFAVHPDH
ncbi:hypothetical protein CAL22_17790 [Bordetella genomosp. 12]|uniref:Uncharacterized protein n=1 Tax=Bordetella genomosp. 12 TaxID=463035 RepID=A0A261VES5_9BORD|nr:hypothetical protein CAL22_17790 [Bordetella genomosp. 12]